MSIPINCPNCNAFVGDYGMNADGTENCPDCGHCINVANHTYAGVEPEPWEPDGIDDPSEGDRVETRYNVGEITALCDDGLVVIELDNGSTDLRDVDELNPA